MRARVRACANKLSKSGFGELIICDLESLFARAESLFARARVGRARARTRARILALLGHLARARLYLLARLAPARLSLLAHLARARVKCSRARAAHPAAGEAPYEFICFESSHIYIYVCVCMCVCMYVM